MPVTPSKICIFLRNKKYHNLELYFLLIKDIHVIISFVVVYSLYIFFLCFMDFNLLKIILAIRVINRKAVKSIA